ncbi:MAG: hypothetical protein JO040_05575, partial [Gemmatimonadetes bacterium]|nr:hypothetical protein [Gemmatimonadota bacterium]
MFRFPFDPGKVATCACSDRAARIEMQGKEFIGQFNGSISVRIGRPEQRQTRETRVPLNIIGYSTQSDVKGMGRTSLDFDFSRPIPTSDVSGDPERGFFPGVQKMRLNILMTT